MGLRLGRRGFGVHVDHPLAGFSVGGQRWGEGMCERPKLDLMVMWSRVKVSSCGFAARVGERLLYRIGGRG